MSRGGPFGGVAPPSFGSLSDPVFGRRLAEGMLPRLHIEANPIPPGWDETDDGLDDWATHERTPAENINIASMHYEDARRRKREQEMRQRGGAMNARREMPWKHFDLNDQEYRNRVHVSGLQATRNKKMCIEIIDESTDEFVIPMPSVLDVKREPKEKTKSLQLIQDFVRKNSANEWSTGEADACSMRNVSTVDYMVEAMAKQAVGRLSSSPYSACITFHDFPSTLRMREGDTLLRPVLIDGCTVVHQTNKNFDVFWRNPRGAEETFQKNKVLLMQPLVTIVLRFLLMGHKVRLLLPAYYEKPTFRDRQKVDDVNAFNVLVRHNLVEFLPEEDITQWWKMLLNKVDEIDACFVASSEVKRKVEYGGEAIVEVDEETNLVRDGEHIVLTDSRPVDRMLTPYFISNRSLLICPLQVSMRKTTEDGRISRVYILADRLLQYREDTKVDYAVRLQEQMTLEDQFTKVKAVCGLVELSPWEVRGAQLLLRAAALLQEAQRENAAANTQAEAAEMSEQLIMAFALD